MTRHEPIGPGPVEPTLPGERSATSVAQLLQAIRERTPARLLVGRAGPAYRTDTQLQLREDHAVAVDAVHARIDLERDFGLKFVADRDLFEVSTCARDVAEFLKQPGLGRRFDEAARSAISERCPTDIDVQIAIGDGLSAAAVAAQVPRLLPRLEQEVAHRGWSLGHTFAIRNCRVGILNDLGDLLRPAVAILLIGERPGLANAESLSAYMAFRPRPGHTDAERNLISNIHDRGLPPEQASERILALADQMMAAQTSGVAIKERFTAPIQGPK